MKRPDLAKVLVPAACNAFLVGYSGPFFAKRDVTSMFPPKGVNKPVELLSLLARGFKRGLNPIDVKTTDGYHWFAGVEWMKRDAYQAGEFTIPANGAVVMLFPNIGGNLPQRQIAFYLNGAIAEHELDAIAERLESCLRGDTAQAA